MHPSQAASRNAPAAHGALLRSFVIALTAFLTVVDLFATQAILQSLAKSYNVRPAANENGEVWTTYTDFSWIARRHAITDRVEQFGTATGVVASITSAIKANCAAL